MSNIHHTAITGELTIFAAQSLKERLLAALGKGHEIEVDLSRVSEMDSAGIQLLLAAEREACARSQILRFVAHSPAVADTLDLCDLSGHFGDPARIPRA